MKIDISPEATEAAGKLKARLLEVNPYVEKRLGKVVSAAVLAFNEQVDTKGLTTLSESLFTATCRRRALIKSIEEIENLDDDAMKTFEKSIQKIKNRDKSETQSVGENSHQEEQKK